MKVVIDTNVLISAILRDRNPEKTILFVVEQPDIYWFVSPEIMAEYKEVLSRDKFKLPSDILRQWYATLDTSTVMVESDISIDFPRDQKDAKFLACSIAAKADYFITGDHDFSEAEKMLTTTILSVSLFKKLVADPIKCRLD